VGKFGNKKHPKGRRSAPFVVKFSKQIICQSLDRVKRYIAAEELLLQSSYWRNFLVSLYGVAVKYRRHNFKFLQIKESMSIGIMRLLFTLQVWTFCLSAKLALLRCSFQKTSLIKSTNDVSLTSVHNPCSNYLLLKITF